MKEMMAALEAAAQKKQVMAIYRDDTGDSWSGIPVMTGPALVVLARERDFTLDGYLAIAAGQITGVEQYDDNDFIRRVMKGEGIYEGCRPPAIPSCRDWKDLLAGIVQSFDRWCIAECTSEEEGELYFYVGKVESLEKNHFTLRPVNAEGGWIKEPVAIPYEDLCTVGFGGNYVRIYQKYTKGR